MPGKSVAVRPPVANFPPVLAERLYASPFNFQAMTQADLPAIITIEQQVYASPWAEMAYQRELQYNTRAYFDVIYYQADVAAYSGMWDLVDDVHVATLVTAPNFRGQGLGQWLLIAIIYRAIALNIPAVSLEVRPSNQSALGLYRKFGFETVGERKKYYPDGENALILTRFGLLEANTQRQLQTHLTTLFDKFNL